MRIWTAHPAKTDVEAGASGLEVSRSPAADEWERDLSWLGELDLADFYWGDTGSHLYVEITCHAQTIEVASSFSVTLSSPAGSSLNPALSGRKHESAARPRCRRDPPTDGPSHAVTQEPDQPEHPALASPQPRDLEPLVEEGSTTERASLRLKVTSADSGSTLERPHSLLAFRGLALAGQCAAQSAGQVGKRPDGLAQR